MFVLWPKSFSRNDPRLITEMSSPVVSRVTIAITFWHLIVGSAASVGLVIENSQFDESADFKALELENNQLFVVTAIPM